MKKQPLVCVIIINWNGGKTTINCLKTLQMTKYNNYKVVVLDNGSTDGSELEIRKKFPNVEMLKSKDNLGYTGGMNYLWSHCLKKYNPKYFCNMNNDIVTVQKNWLALMIKELEKSKENGICGNKLVFPDNRLQLLYVDRKPEHFEEKDTGKYDFVREVTAVGGANMLVKTEVIRKIGGVDENFFYGPDDIDYCLRARKAGFKIIYNGLSKSVHVGSFSYLSSKKDFIYEHQSYGQMVFTFRHGTIKEKLFMPINQLIRTIVTRKDPFRKKSINNLYFHSSFLKRFIYFTKSLHEASRNYKKINNTHFKHEKRS